MWKAMAEDISTMRARDPAARSSLEILLCYPSLHALIAYRIANFLWRRRWYLLARMISQTARFLTGIEIHPGATIGRHFFIDHGMGVVIGETAEIGDDVTLYQDVTLGGVSPSENSDQQRCVKRHPTLEDGVIVGSGAQILGPITIGKNARVGANAVVVNEVAAGVTVVGIPARVVLPRSERTQAFSPYGVPAGDLPDPVARALDGLLDQVASLRSQVEALEERLEEKERGETTQPTFPPQQRKSRSTGTKGSNLA